MRTHTTNAAKPRSINLPSLLKRAVITTCFLAGSAFTAGAVSIIISGTVKDDGDGGLISGTPISSVVGNQLYVYLIDNSNTVVDRSAVSGASFTYSLTAQANLNYSVALSTAYYPISTTNPILGLPVSFAPTAEGTTLVGDGTPDYLVAINSSNSLTVNFAIDERPIGYSFALGSSLIVFDLNGRIIIPGGAFTGTDAEDGNYAPGLYGRKVDLYQATGGQLYYNNSLISFSSAAIATRISNFDVSLLRFEPAPNGARQFAFSIVDNASVPEAVPNSITLPGTVLPIAFASFNGSVQEDNNRLTWQTAAEQSCKEFIIERSEDGARFRTIAIVASKARNGNSSQPLNYDYIDYSANSAPHAPYYYRVRQTGLDGGFNYSGVVRLANSYTQEAQIQLAPNPSNGSVSIDMATGSAGNANVEIIVYNATGGLVQRRGFEVSGGRLSTALDLSAAPAGTYYVQLRSSDAPAISKSLVLLPH